MKALIFGGSGALGRSMVKVFKGWKVTSVDFNKNEECDNIIIKNANDINFLKSELNTLEKFNCIVCVAGGWTGGSIKDENVLQVYEDMNQKSVVPALVCSHLATTQLSRQGLLIFTGAYSVFNAPTPSMIGYALAKTAVHTLAIQTAVSTHLPEDSAVITLLPETIDTPANRQAMPKEDFSKWANPDQIAGLVRSWAEGLNRPKNGAFVHLKIKNGSIAPDFL
ncbi:unnamed protein product [Paramecium primaurelia]|uniref:Dihydropteridine reductase n=1 Tax=Paramecium primaurelia TaxID=5886 RepID=A0A8S1MVS3_PARPR|nr:unnamed protein product [Paramecium primaurelia]